MLANHSQEWKFDLQRFAEDNFSDKDFITETPTEDDDKSGEPDDETTKDDLADDKKGDTTPAEEFDEIDYNHETVKVPVSKRKELLQKGYHYDEVRAERDKARKLAESLGYKSIEELEAAVSKQRIEDEAKQYAAKENISEEAAKRIIANEQRLKELEARDASRDFRSTADKQKAALKEKPFFKELEAEIDATVEDCISRGQIVDVETVYNYLRGKNLDTLLEQAKKQTEKSTVANIHDRAKRGGVISSDNKDGDELDTTDIDLKMAQAFGTDPKAIAKYKRQQLKGR